VPHDPPNAPPDGAACDLLVANVGQLVTPEGACGDGPLRGARHGSLRVVPRAALAVRGGRVVWAGPAAEWRGDARATLDAGGAAVVPGLVDPHTHLVWAGDRLDDFEARARGEGYEAILARGGGIRHTVRRTAAAPVDALVALARPRLDALVRSGATTVEVKSGYGLTPDAELRMLEAVAALRAHTPPSSRPRSSSTSRPPTRPSGAPTSTTRARASSRRSRPRGSPRRSTCSSSARRSRSTRPRASSAPPPRAGSARSCTPTSSTR
jgi:imidazolonepropionase